MPTGGQTKITKTRANEKTKTSKMKTTTIIKATTGTKIVMGGIENGFIICHTESKC